MEMYHKQGILKSLENLSGEGAGGGWNPHNSELGGENGSFLLNSNQKKKKKGENVRPLQLLFSQNPELVLLGRRLPGFSLPWCFFYLDNSLPRQARRQLK